MSRISPEDLSPLGVRKEDRSTQISYSGSPWAYAPENHWEETVQEILGFQSNSSIFFPSLLCKRENLEMGTTCTGVLWCTPVKKEDNLSTQPCSRHISESFWLDQDMSRNNVKSFYTWIHVIKIQQMGERVSEKTKPYLVWMLDQEF